MPESRRSSRFKRLVLAAFFALTFTLAIPSLSLAADDATPDHDARLDGYAQKTVLDSGGTASSYIVLVLLGGLGLGVMFIKGKRSHLD